MLVPSLLGAAAWAVQHGPLDLAQARLFTDDATQTFDWRLSVWLDVLGNLVARGLRRDAGHCMPSGHAGAGFALLALYFAGWAAGRPVWRWRGLVIGITADLAFSGVRMMLGAHFESATVWSAAITWTLAALFFLPLVCRAATPRP